MTDSIAGTMDVLIADHTNNVTLSTTTQSQFSDPTDSERVEWIENLIDVYNNWRVEGRLNNLEEREYMAETFIQDVGQGIKALRGVGHPFAMIYEDHLLCSGDNKKDIRRAIQRNLATMLFDCADYMTMLKNLPEGSECRTSLQEAYKRDKRESYKKLQNLCTELYDL